MAKINDGKRDLLNELISAVRVVSSSFAGGKQVVTEDHQDVEKLLNTWEKVLCFGIKGPSTLLGNVQELFSSSTSGNGSQFWAFAVQQLTKHEQERFSNFKNIWTDRGKTKALIRNALNERCLERYLLTWLGSENLQEFYEPTSLLRDEKSQAILPKLASDLSTILFAINIDTPELNVASSKSPAPSKTEPIIASKLPNTNIKVKSVNVTHRSIEQFEETQKPDADQKVIEPSLPSEQILSPPVHVHETPAIMINEASLTAETLKESSFEWAAENDTTYKYDDAISHSSSSTEDEEPPHVLHHTASVGQMENEFLIQKQRERITELENQVLELTMENTRLKNLLSTTKVNSLCNFQVSIPRAVLQKTKTKNFYAYEINLKSKNGQETWTIFRRYRDFYKLHKELKHEYLQIKILDFPPKKKIGNLDFDFVEHRRQRLQVYLRHVLQNLPEVANCETRQNLEAKCPFFRT